MPSAPQRVSMASRRNLEQAALVSQPQSSQIRMETRNSRKTHIFPIVQKGGQMKTPSSSSHDQNYKIIPNKSIFIIATVQFIPIGDPYILPITHYNITLRESSGELKYVALCFYKTFTKCSDFQRKPKVSVNRVYHGEVKLRILLLLLFILFHMPKQHILPLRTKKNHFLMLYLSSANSWHHLVMFNQVGINNYFLNIYRPIF